MTLPSPSPSPAHALPDPPVSDPPASKPPVSDPPAPDPDPPPSDPPASDPPVSDPPATDRLAVEHVAAPVTDIRKPRSAYHHGDLRSALLSAARRELDAGAYETLSLRELARLAGVSPNAPYRHFTSKDEILAEIAAQGFTEMSARFDAETCPDPRERLVRLCDLYTDFAREHPNVYRVMFGAEKPALMEFDVLRDAARASFGRLVAAVVAASGPDGTDEKLVLGRASQLWSLIHGWARLVIDGVACVLPEDCILPASAGARALVAGW